ncbi:hypothetical protein Y032_0180g784 [Ancylostoma ceylanicum]|uniref:Uncharacterized protein n=1 Tax=Ancylostoma ceylanicum TaxID=53326 RepID=A0A016SSE2_9BILA|nr:hypothetical protein Y032_0180g784 [Ancylostoma ceylanicum]
MASVTGYPIDYVTLRDTGYKSWFANLDSLGFAFTNSSPAFTQGTRSNGEMTTTLPETFMNTGTGALDL